MFDVMPLRFPLLFLALALFVSACGAGNEAGSTEKKFDAAQWKVKEGDAYPHRDAMLKDLMGDSAIRKLEKAELVALLGEPDRENNHHLYYPIARTKMGFLTLNSKTLVIKMFPDSTVEWMKIHE